MLALSPSVSAMVREPRPEQTPLMTTICRGFLLESIKMNGTDIPPSMGVSQAINFQTEGQKAATTGDFVLTANKVNPVVRTLKEYGIAVTALRSHMLTETPRLFFMHFWAVDNPDKLAYGLRKALGLTNTIM